MREELTGATLAYLGDAVIELCCRERLISFGITSAAVLSSEALAFVTAKSQSEAFLNIEALLTEEETDVFRRGRNAHVTVPKSASRAEYHRATGMEALFAALYLEGRHERIDELFGIAYKDKIDDVKRRHDVK